MKDEKTVVAIAMHTTPTRMQKNMFQIVVMVNDTQKQKTPSSLSHAIVVSFCVLCITLSRQKKNPQQSAAGRANNKNRKDIRIKDDTLMHS